MQVFEDGYRLKYPVVMYCLISTAEVNKTENIKFRSKYLSKYVLPSTTAHLSISQTLATL